MIVRAAHRILQKLSLYITDQPVTSSVEAEAYIEELQMGFRILAQNQNSDFATAENEWAENIERLTELVLGNDPRNFLRWDVILKSMFVDCAPYISTELKYLQTISDWRDRWKKAIEESPIGHPIPYWKFPRSSANLIHHAFHLSQFERITRQNIQNVDFIFEFGGGYGSFCRLCHNLGFKGTYFIFDLPHFSILQQYYLKSIGLNVLPADKSLSNLAGVICISDVETLSKSLSIHAGEGESLFIATWSLSETPLSFRKKIAECAGNCSRILIAYQDHFQGIDNHCFFSEWTKSQPNKLWHCWEIQHLKKNRYLIGTLPIKGDHISQ